MERMTVKKGFGFVVLLLLGSATGVHSEQNGSYVGSKKCAPCHSAINGTWEKTRHAKAIESLKKSGQETLPACVKCHVTGYEKDGGFIDYELTPEMAGVQCEVCHGPGSAHISNPMGKTITKEAGAGLCRQCHTEGQDPGFNYEAKVKNVHGE
ncbi:MAG: cytochrome c family protein [Acidobacteriota bacterium]|nr:cytochrome c family protein [Acidobacteriota bacterium]